MDVQGVGGLIQDIEAPFLLLGIALVIMTINSRAANHSKSYELTTRLVLFCMLLSFIAMQGVLLYQDRAVLMALWEQSPVLYPLLCVIGGIVELAVVSAIAYWKLRPELWRNGDEQSGDCGPK